MGTKDIEDLDLDELQYMVLVDRQASILVVDDEEVIHQLFKKLLSEQNYTVDFAVSGEGALEKLRVGEYNLVIVDKNMPGMSGLDLMRSARKLQPQLEFIVITGFGSKEAAIEALRLGAFDFIEKPFEDMELVKEKVVKALERQQLSYENQVLADHLREAHKDLSGTIENLGKSIHDVEKVHLYMRSMVAKTTRQLKIENTELRLAVNGVGAPLKHAREKVKTLLSEGKESAGLAEVKDLIERGLKTLASHAQKIKE